MASRHETGASWRSIRLQRCRSTAVGARHLHTYKRLGVTLMATMGVPRVPSLSEDALPYHLHAGRGRDGQWELQDRECAHHVDMINRIMSK